MTDDCIEEWRDIPGYEGRYQISNQGRVKSLARIDPTNHRWAEKILATNLDRKGYPRITLERRVWHIHRLVLLAFVGEQNSLQCNHINGNKQDNRVENLEYCTGQENMIHAYRVLGRTPPHRGTDHHSSKLNETSVREIRSAHARGCSISELSRRFHVTRPSIQSVVRNKTWKHVK